MLGFCCYRPVFWGDLIKNRSMLGKMLRVGNFSVIVSKIILCGNLAFYKALFVAQILKITLCCNTSTQRTYWDIN
jgi:hypothetical protein